MTDRPREAGTWAKEGKQEKQKQKERTSRKTQRSQRRNWRIKWDHHTQRETGGDSVTGWKRLGSFYTVRKEGKQEQGWRWVLQKKEKP